MCLRVLVSVFDCLCVACMIVCLCLCVLGYVCDCLYCVNVSFRWLVGCAFARLFDCACLCVIVCLFVCL